MNSIDKNKINNESSNKSGIQGSRIVLPENYVPTDIEEYMNENHLEFFRQKLLIWKKELLNEASDTKDDLSEDGLQRPDIADRAQVESNAAIQLRTRDRERKLTNKIAISIEKIKQDDYGWCESCGDEIGIKRLEARPTATHCIHCKTLDEIKEKQLSG